MSAGWDDLFEGERRYNAANPRPKRGKDAAEKKAIPSVKRATATGLLSAPADQRHLALAATYDELADRVLDPSNPKWVGIADDVRASAAEGLRARARKARGLHR